MSKFTASNGLRVEADTSGDIYVHDVQLYPREASALREFFQHERDAELGRWRWPENPEYIVYPIPWDRHRVRVVYEPDGIAHALSPDSATSEDNGSHRAARAYFDAHPVRKPWHDAKPGEVWVLKEHGQPDRAYLVDGSQFYDYSRDYALDFEDSVILDARRIWPEDDS